MSDRQITIDEAIAAGDDAMQRCADKAHERDARFSEKAERAMLEHLRVVRQASGEDLTDVARAHGATPHDDRAFGAVFKSMARRGVIRAAGFCLRKKGHGTAGGRLWELAKESAPT